MVLTMAATLGVGQVATAPPAEAAIENGASGPMANAGTLTKATYRSARRMILNATPQAVTTWFRGQTRSQLLKLDNIRLDLQPSSNTFYNLQIQVGAGAATTVATVLVSRATIDRINRAGSAVNPQTLAYYATIELARQVKGALIQSLYTVYTEGQEAMNYAVTGNPSNLPQRDELRRLLSQSDLVTQAYSVDALPLEVGGIADQADAEQVCPTAATGQGRTWNGHWTNRPDRSLGTTTKRGFCGVTADTVAFLSETLNDGRDAQETCPRAADDLFQEWTGVWDNANGNICVLKRS